jgi:hypothetical protein
MSDKHGNLQCELAGGISAVEPASQVLCIVMDESSFMMAKCNGFDRRERDDVKRVAR